MAKRGVKPKPPALKVVRGNPGKRPLPIDIADIEIRKEPLEPLEKLTKKQQRLWDRFINAAWWLTDFDVPKAFSWVCLKSEFLKDTKGMTSALIAQIRILESDLGLDPGERTRMGIGTGEKEDATDKFFD